MAPHRLRLPISTRHAFALAFDLAARRDFVVSLLIPLLLRSPWILALVVLPPLNETDQPGRVMLLTLGALIGDFVMRHSIEAMLRFRARSVFNTPAYVRPASIAECYELGLRRLPWLIMTDLLRSAAVLIAFFFLLLPAVLLGFKLIFADDAVVLHEPNASRAFQRSFRLTEGRFERWLEMMVACVLLLFAVIVFVGFLSVIVPGIGVRFWVALTILLFIAVTPIIQYAWTFFYLRLVEIESPAPGIEVGPAYAAAPVSASAEEGGTGISPILPPLSLPGPGPEGTHPEHAT
jgi:hypothetical protein